MLHQSSVRLLFVFALLFTAAARAQIPGIGPAGAITRAQTGFQFTEGPAADIVFLLLYGSGFSFYSSLSNVSLTIGKTTVEVFGIGALPGFVGLDQVAAQLPRSLAGSGEVGVVLTVDGVMSNTVTVNIK